MKRLLILALLLSSVPAWATTYYVSTSGLDTNNGTSTSTPWQTIAHVNAQTFSAGDSILFQDGGVWYEELIVPSAGSSGNQIIFGSYGSGAQPIISGSVAVTGWSSVSGSVVENQNVGTTLGERPFGYNSSYERVGQPFTTTTSYTVNSVTVSLAKIGSPTNNVWVEIYSNSGGVPGSVITNGTSNVIAESTLTTTATPYNFTFSTPPSLTSGTEYWIVLQQTGDATSTTNYVPVYFSLASGTDAHYTPWTTETPYTWYYQVYSSGTIANVYQASMTTQPTVVSFNGLPGTQETSVAALTADREWYWNANVLYVYTAAPASGEDIEMGIRNYAILASGKQYLTFSGIDIRGANLYGFYDAAANDSGLQLLNDTVELNGSHGLYLNDQTDTVTNVFVQGNTFRYNGASGFEADVHLQSGWQILNNTAYSNALNMTYSGDYQYTGGIRVGCGYGAGTAYTGPTLVAGNLSYNNGPNGTSSSHVSQGVGIWSDSCNSVNLAYNYTHDNWASGIMVEKNNSSAVNYNISWNDDRYSLQAYTWDITEGGCIWLRAGETTNSSNVSITNNTCYAGGVGLSIDSYDASTITGTIVKNNIAVASTNIQFYMGPGGNNDGTHGSGNVYQYNSFGTAGSTLAYWTGNGVISTYAGLDTSYGSSTNSITTQPAFTSAGTGNFTLPAGSSAIGSGTPVSGYGVGLLPASAWPSGIVTGTQASAWNIGAYLTPSGSNAFWFAIP